MKLIKAVNTDLDMVMDIRLEMLRAVNGLSDGMPFNKEFINNTREYFKSSGQTTVLAVEDSEAIGCASICYINVMPTFDHPTGKRAHIMNVYTRADYRRHGIALKMMAWLMEEVRQKEITEISLDATEAGRALYEKCGFVRAEECMVWYEAGHKKEK